MKLKAFIDTPPWEWPEDADRIILKALRDNEANESEHLLAAEAAFEAIEMTDMLSDLKDDGLGDEFIP